MANKSMHTSSKVRCPIPDTAGPAVMSKTSGTAGAGVSARGVVFGSWCAIRCMLLDSANNG